MPSTARRCPLDPVGTVEGDRPAAAEADDRVRARGQRADRVRRGVDRGRIVDRAAAGPAFPAETSTKIPAAWSVIDDRAAKCSPRSPRSPGNPSCCSSRAAAKPGSGSAPGGRRRDEELEALGVRRRGAVALVHVPAADPLRAGATPIWFARAVVTGGGCRHVCAVEGVVARLLVVGRADSAAGVDRVDQL